MSEQSRFTDKDKAEKSDQLYETTEYSRRCLCDDMVELAFDNIKLNAMIKKSEEDFANLQNKLMCSLLLILGSDDDVDRIIEKTDELTRAFKDERVSTLQHENAKLRELMYKRAHVYAIQNMAEDELRITATNVMEDNAKLRELVRALADCRNTTCDDCVRWDYPEGGCLLDGVMRQLGVEAGE